MYSLTKQRAGPGPRPAQRTSSPLHCIKVSSGRETLLSCKTGISYVSACGFLGRPSTNDKVIDITDLSLHLHITESLHTLLPLFAGYFWMLKSAQEQCFPISFFSTLLPGLVSKLLRPLGGRPLLPLLFGGGGSMACTPRPGSLSPLCAPSPPSLGSWNRPRCAKPS